MVGSMGAQGSTANPKEQAAPPAAPAPAAPQQPKATFSEPQKLQAEPRKGCCSARSKISDITDPVAYGGSQREHPGRIMSKRQRIGAAHGKRKQAHQGTRPPRHGDPQLKLDVDGLNGFEAMMATMKEMGYESDEEEEAEAEATADVETGNAGAAAPAAAAVTQASAAQQPSALANGSQAGSTSLAPKPFQAGAVKSTAAVKPGSTAAARRSSLLARRAPWWVVGVIAILCLSFTAAAVTVIVLAINSDGFR